MTDPATIYEEWRVPAVFAPLARQVLDQTEIPPGARVLDVACGSGIVARGVAQRMGPAGRVVGLDFNQGMLEAARRAAAAEEVDIEWREGNAEDLPFANASFDLVFCQQSLQFFPDRGRALAEMHRVLVPGGKVVIATWRGLDRHPFSAALDRAVRRRLSAPGLETAFSLGEPATLAMLVREAGFSDVSIEPITIEANYAQPERFVELHVAAAAAGIPTFHGMDTAARASLIEDIREEMAEPVRQATIGDRVRFPLQAIVARALRQ
jgi:SAM-dependent methyltransferase